MVTVKSCKAAIRTGCRPAAKIILLECSESAAIAPDGRSFRECKCIAINDIGDRGWQGSNVEATRSILQSRVVEFVSVSAMHVILSSMTIQWAIIDLLSSVKHVPVAFISNYM